MAKPKYHKWLEPDGLILLEGWARDGLTEEQIAHNMGISIRTLQNWKQTHVPILQALKKGKEVVDFEVENSLLKKAKGFYETEDRLDKDGNPFTIRKYYPPDATALIFWLKNRRPDKWRDRKDFDVDMGEQTAGVVILPEIGKPDE